MKEIGIQQLGDLFQVIADQYVQYEGELSRLDSKLGDGDLGLTMKKGFGLLPDLLRTMDEPELSKRLMKAGMEMMDSIPSTMGMLMGTGLSYGGRVLTGKTAIDATGLAAFLEGYAAGIEKRGKCSRGDCTVLDSIAPAADATIALLNQNPDATLEAVAKAALQGAEEGMEATKHMTPRFGKAAVHAADAGNEPDQGAVAGWILVKGIFQYLSF